MRVLQYKQSTAKCGKLHTDKLDLEGLMIALVVHAYRTTLRVIYVLVVCGI